MAGEYIKVFVDCLETWKRLTDEEAGQLLRALLLYKRNGEEPPLSGGAFYTFPGEKAKIDRDADSYQKRCDTNSINGAKGGRPKKTEKNPKNRMGFSETQKSQDKEKDKEKEKDLNTPPTPPQPKVQLAENVTMTNDEYEKLLAAYGPADTMRLIDILDNYKGSTGKKYKSDYRAILSWCVDRLTEEQKKSMAGGVRDIADSAWRYV